MANETEEYNNKKERIISMISIYPFSCDMILSSFFACVFSNRFESRTSPFPPAFLNAEKIKDIDSLRKLLQSLPPLAIIRKLLRYKGDFEYLDILDWLFTVIDPKSLELTETSHLQLPIDQQPNIVFGLRQSPNLEKAWNRKKGQKNTLHAFYGTNLENLFSILKYGLNPTFSTVTAPLYGDGLYLTNQMNVSLLFSPFSEVWKYSLLGDKLRVLILCEIIEDPSKIKRLKKQRSLEEQLKCTYIIVKDKNYIRPKYFFVYTKDLQNQSHCLKEIYLRVVFAIFLIFTLVWLYVNTNVLHNIIGPFFFK